jgi:hypothetical protein
MLREIRLPFALTPHESHEVVLPKSLRPPDLTTPVIDSVCTRLASLASSVEPPSTLLAALAPSTNTTVDVRRTVDSTCACARRSLPLGRALAAANASLVLAADDASLRRALRLAAAIDAATDGLMADPARLLALTRATPTPPASDASFLGRKVRAIHFAASSYAERVAPRGPAYRATPHVRAQLAAGLHYNIRLAVDEEERLAPHSPNARAGRLLAAAAGLHGERAYVDRYVSWNLRFLATAFPAADEYASWAAPLLTPAVLCAPAEDFFFRRIIALWIRFLAATAEPPPAKPPASPAAAALGAADTGSAAAAEAAAAWGAANEREVAAWAGGEAYMGWRTAFEDREASWFA